MISGPLPAGVIVAITLPRLFEASAAGWQIRHVAVSRLSQSTVALWPNTATALDVGPRYNRAVKAVILNRQRRSAPTRRAETVVARHDV